MESINLNIIPFSIETDDVLNHLRSDGVKGLSLAEAKLRLTSFGSNKISTEKNKSAWVIFFSQFKSPIVWLLIVAAGLPFYIDEWLDGIAILIVILINALIGFTALESFVYTSLWGSNENPVVFGIAMTDTLNQVQTFVPAIISIALGYFAWFKK